MSKTWIEWHGGPWIGDPNASVELKFRGGELTGPFAHMKPPFIAQNWRWEWSEQEPETDILAWRYAK